MRSRIHSVRGVSLLEICIVVMVLGIIGIVLMQNWLNTMEDSRHGAALKGCRLIADAARRYMVDNEEFPERIEDLLGRYLTGPEALKDPWGHSYLLDGRCVLSQGPDYREVNAGLLEKTWQRCRKLTPVVAAIVPGSRKAQVYDLKNYQEPLQGHQITDPWGNYLKFSTELGVVFFEAPADLSKIRVPYR